jgi:mono/diheme cytochrome c family protein
MNKTPVRTFLSLLLLGMVFALSGAARATRAQKQPGPAAPTGNPQHGKTVFENLGCNRCHGSQGEGLAGSGQNPGIPRIASTSMSLPDFLRQVRKPKGQMPPFSSKQASDADVADMYAYMQSLKPVEVAAAAAPGNAANGERLFQKDGCYECHGLRGQGSSSTGATRLGPPRIPLSAFVAYVREPSGEMPPYTTKAVSDKDLEEIYNFLKSVPSPPSAKSIPLLNQ